MSRTGIGGATDSRTCRQPKFGGGGTEAESTTTRTGPEAHPPSERVTEKLTLGAGRAHVTRSRSATAASPPHPSYLRHPPNRRATLQLHRLLCRRVTTTPLVNRSLHLMPMWRRRAAPWVPQNRLAVYISVWNPQKICTRFPSLSRGLRAKSRHKPVNPPGRLWNFSKALA
ncbi:hypothetical protein Enr13x_53980 [Stieleria neptunia]|uniref:Uncharacterized protein n=1 Tax=Stieleria neptunia TaxID=2527979 RepID=A0A518HXC9_9BACT|nr:hypothetical protein Enr13x_53980 [Stieleria neptunia]